MMKLGAVVVGLVALTSVGCAATPGAPARLAQASTAIASDATATAMATATSTSTSTSASPSATPAGRTTTLALGIGDAAEPKADDAKEAKSDEPFTPPSTCATETSINATKVCLPEAAYAKKLCSGVYPEVSLGLFGKGTPWTRIYLAGDVEAWNASGGRTHRAKLAFDEEVIVLGKHGAGANGGIVMTGAQASYDVLRWDGSCVSVMEGEITTRRPPAPKPAEVNFSRLEESTRHALLAMPKVKATHEALFKACTSVSSPLEKKTCDKADKAFALAIAEAVRAGSPLPAPGRRP